MFLGDFSSSSKQLGKGRNGLPPYGVLERDTLYDSSAISDDVDRSCMPCLTLRPLGGFSGRKLNAVETCGVWRAQETSCPSVVEGFGRRLVHPSHSGFWAVIVRSELRRLACHYCGGCSSGGAHWALPDTQGYAEHSESPRPLCVIAECGSNEWWTV